MWAAYSDDANVWCAQIGNVQKHTVPCAQGLQMGDRIMYSPSYGESQMGDAGRFSSARRRAYGNGRQCCRADLGKCKTVFTSARRGV